LTVAFAFLAGMTLVSALGVVLSRSVVHSALFMSSPRSRCLSTSAP
jgi:NAD(P)H-quinone oxidoreductase subunit 6